MDSFTVFICERIGQVMREMDEHYTTSGVASRIRVELSNYPELSEAFTASYSAVNPAVTMLEFGCPKCDSAETYETTANVNGRDARIALCDACGHTEVK